MSDEKCRKLERELILSAGHVTRNGYYIEHIFLFVFKISFTTCTY